MTTSLKIARMNGAIISGWSSIASNNSVHQNELSNNHIATAVNGITVNVSGATTIEWFCTVSEDKR